MFWRSRGVECGEVRSPAPGARPGKPEEAIWLGTFASVEGGRCPERRGIGPAPSPLASPPASHDASPVVFHGPAGEGLTVQSAWTSLRWIPLGSVRSVRFEGSDCADTHESTSARITGARCPRRNGAEASLRAPIRSRRGLTSLLGRGALASPMYSLSGGCAGGGASSGARGAQTPVARAPPNDSRRLKRLQGLPRTPGFVDSAPCGRELCGGSEQVRAPGSGGRLLAIRKESRCALCTSET